MHVFHFLLAVAIFVAAVSTAPQDDHYDTIVDISDGTPEPPKEYYNPESDPEWVNNFGKIPEDNGRFYNYRSYNSDVNDNNLGGSDVSDFDLDGNDLSDSDLGDADLGESDLDDYNLQEDPDVESPIYARKYYPWLRNYDYRYGRAVSNPWLCPAPSSDLAKKGEQIIKSLKVMKMFPQRKSLTINEASAVAAYIRKVDAKQLCPRATGAKMGILITDREACFVNCAQAPKTVSVQRCVEGTVFRTSGIDLYSVTLERSAIIFDAPKGECVRKLVPSPVQVTAQFPQIKTPVKNVQRPRYEKRGKPFWAPEWLDYRGEDYSDQI